MKEDERFYRFIDELKREENRTNEGQALLYAVEKTAERTKREVFLKIAEWLGGNIHKYAENVMYTRLINDLKQAMQDEKDF